MMMKINRNSATKLLLVQWARFQNTLINLQGSTLITGVNGSGKSTILDAMTYLLTGNTQFNKAAKDRDRTVTAYVRGDTKSNGSSRYLRNGDVVSYIAMEFFSPTDNSNFVVFVCIESANETSSHKSDWFIVDKAKIEQINFTKINDKTLVVTPKNGLRVNGKPIDNKIKSKDSALAQIFRKLGLRGDYLKYRNRLMKMMAFNPENNIDKFIQECVLDAGKVDSLAQLREQKQLFERIKAEYQNMKDSKTQLEIIEKKTSEYENKLKNFNIKKLMFDYQYIMQKQAYKQDLLVKLEKLKHERQTLDNQKLELNSRYEAANERFINSQNNDIYKGIQDSIKDLEQQINYIDRELITYKSQLEKLKHLQDKINNILSWADSFLNLNEKTCLSNLLDKNNTQKTDIFLKFSAQIANQDKIFQTEEVHLKDDITNIENELSQLETDIKTLEANKRVFPKHIEKAKLILSKELEKQGINTDVRLLSELVSEVKNPDWRNAIETFLGKKRFYIIVDGKYCFKAMEIIKQQKLTDIQLIITDKLPDIDITSGSAAEMLVTHNPFARKYLNYLLNGIHLCNSLEELHQHPKGGIMKNGMLAKSYSMSMMDMQNVKLYLGEDSIKYQLENAKIKKQELKNTLDKIKSDLDSIKKYRNDIQNIDFNINSYNFNVLNDIDRKNIEKNNILSSLDNLKNNPEFLAITEEREQAKKQLDKITNERDNLSKNIGVCEKDYEYTKNLVNNISDELEVLQNNFNSNENLELKNSMLEEYSKLSKQKQSIIVITESALKALEHSVNDTIDKLEDSQLAYCKIAGIDLNKRGIGMISFYRERYRDLANVKIEQASERLNEQSKKLQSVFMNDFVSEINETIKQAQDEINAINKELRQIPFGNDTYKFVMSEKPDRAVFFRISKELNKPEYYMNFASIDEQIENDINEFMEIILNESDETEYTDYRKYFTYDMKIISKQGNDEVIADLSKKQGSASNGEKQTPYFIILAAALNQFYPKNFCCARLAFIDEAFSALSRERIEQMVKYFEENDFQVFYAAPPEKINSIGAFIGSTVSLITKGRYTNAIEGLTND